MKSNLKVANLLAVTTSQKRCVIFMSLCCTYVSGKLSALTCKMCVGLLLHCLHVKVEICLDCAVLSTDFVSVLISSKKRHHI